MFNKWQRQELFVVSNVMAGPIEKYWKKLVGHTFLQTHRTLLSKTPSPLFKSISKEYTYNTRNAAAGSIRYDESFVTDTFKNRARIVYNQVPIDVRTGSLGTVKKKLKAWIKANVPMDFG